MKQYTAEEIIKKMGLIPHEAEGGFFIESLKSSAFIDPHFLNNNHNGERALYTSIYYMLTPETISMPHVLKSDEIWNFHFGDEILLHQFSEEKGFELTRLGNDIFDGQKPQEIIHANTIQAGRLAPGGKFAIVSTVVVPGFEYDDFALVDPHELQKKYPDVDLIDFISKADSFK